MPSCATGYRVEARAGRILEAEEPADHKESTLGRDESRINSHTKPLLGNRVASKRTIADVEHMQDDVKNGKTAKERGSGRGGRVTVGAGVASGCMGTIQAILGHAKHKGLLAAHPTKGAKKLTGNKKTRRLSIDEIEMRRSSFSIVGSANFVLPRAVGRSSNRWLMG